MLLTVSGPVWLLPVFLSRLLHRLRGSVVIFSLEKRHGLYHIPMGPCPDAPVSSVCADLAMTTEPRAFIMEYLSTADSTKQHSAQMNCFI